MTPSTVTVNEAARLPTPGDHNAPVREREQQFDDLATLAAQICEMPISLVCFTDGSGQWLKSTTGLAIDDTLKDMSFCTRAILQKGISVVTDALNDARFCNDPLVSGPPFIRFYAGVPVLSENGSAVGTLSVMDKVPRNLTDGQKFGLEVLARQVECLLSLRAKISFRQAAVEKLEAANNRFRYALEKIGDNVWEHDFSTGISLFSKAENDLLGCSTAGNADNSALWWNSIHKEDKKLLEENDRKYKKGEIDAHVLEYRMIHKNGSVRWVLDRGVAIEKTTEGLPLKLIGTHTDITFLKKNEEALKESQQRWQFALEGSGDGIWDWNLQTDKVFYSRRWKDMLGYSEEEIGDDLKDWEALVHPDDIANVMHELQIHFSEEMPFYQSEHRLLCKDGTYKWILDRGMVITRDADNKPTRAIGTHTDISQIKYTELALEQRLKQFKSLSDNIPGVIYEYEFRKDGSEGLRYVSPGIARIFGITPEEFYNYENYVHPDDIGFIRSKNKASNETLEPFHCEARLVVPGRGILWHSVSSSFSYWSENGSKVFTGFMLDITERKNSDDQLKIKEEKYRSIIANMNLGLLEVDNDDKILFANQSFCDMSGYEYDELIGRKPADIFIFGENRELINQKNESRKQGKSDAYQIAVSNKRGQLRWWLISGAPRYNDTGQVVGSIGIHLDITKQKKLEIDLIEARVQAEQSTRSKEVFLANMSHEIRTPMNAIVGMSNQLAKTSLDSTQQFYLETINAASENLLFIINDILDLSKIEAGKLQVEKIGFNPKDVVNRAIRVLSHKAEEKGLIITNAGFDLSISTVLMGDPFRLNQVLLNLLNNAIKFTERGIIEISCELLSQTELTQTVRMAVKDTGIGMEETFVKNLFEKFSQEDASVTRQYGGTGLGMSISRDLVELMGGKINVESKKAVGTTISFVIEFKKGTSDNLPVKQAFTFDAHMLENKRILVVDDNQMNRLVAATILKNSGAIISEAVNGQEAVDILAQGNIDLVLMDIQMPVMDGVEATGIVRDKISKSLPVIALTANAIKGDDVKYIGAGMNAYLSKPFKEKDLLNIVAFWLNKNQSNEGGNLSGNLPLPVSLYDLSGIYALSRGDKDFIKKIIRLFLMQAPSQIAEMEEKYHRGDYAAVRGIILRIKSVTDNMGIVSLKEPVVEVEKKLRLETKDESIAVLLNKIKTTISEVVSELKEAFPV